MGLLIWGLIALFAVAVAMSWWARQRSERRPQRRSRRRQQRRRR